MSVLPIVLFGDPGLRLPGRPVVHFDRKLCLLIDGMIETMDAAPGAGLAAHQVGVDLQLCVIRVEGRLFEAVNPRLLHLSGEEDAWEGCLSLPGFRASRTRAAHAVMAAQDRAGRRVTISGRGELARAIQHEFDHLQGELYTDRLAEGAEIVSEDALERSWSEPPMERGDPD